MEEKNGECWNAGIDSYPGDCLGYFRCWQASSDWGKHGKSDPKLQKCDREREKIDVTSKNSEEISGKK